jgi:phosphate transport system permease protein
VIRGGKSIRSGRSRGELLAERAFVGLARFATLLPLLILLSVFSVLLVVAWPRLDWDFLTGWPSRKPELAGVLPGLVGTLLLGLGTAGIALPLGVAAAIWLEELAPLGSRLARIVELNVANLAGVPSVIYGLLGLELFVRGMRMERSVLAGACTLSILVLPVVILASREALRTVPRSLREAGWALGATRWQVVRRVVLPEALPGILTGAILALARAVGETAPLVVIGAVAYITYLPDGPRSEFTALPIQVFSWVSRPQHGFVVDAAAGILVLLLVLAMLDAVAVFVRDRALRRTA